MYRYLFIFICVISLIGCASVSDEAQASVLAYENTNDGKGNYEFSYRTSNGIARSETGRLVNAGLPDEHVVVEGTYTYTDPDGTEHTVHYTADENGYVIREPYVTQTIVSAVNPSIVATLLG